MMVKPSDMDTPEAGRLSGKRPGVVVVDDLFDMQSLLDGNGRHLLADPAHLPTVLWMGLDLAAPDRADMASPTPFDRSLPAEGGRVQSRAGRRA